VPPVLLVYLKGRDGLFAAIAGGASSASSATTYIESGSGVASGGRTGWVAGIDFHDLAIGLPAALVIMLMPFSFTITNGIGFGFIAYCLIRATQGRVRDVRPLMWAVSAAFTLYFFVPLLQDHVSWI
jgi:AGZA family xanthine/uracil permease-like MFS transporter